MTKQESAFIIIRQEGNCFRSSLDTKDIPCIKCCIDKKGLPCPVIGKKERVAFCLDYILKYWKAIK
jgi:hypothetical protein